MPKKPSKRKPGRPKGARVQRPYRITLDLSDSEHEALEAVCVQRECSRAAALRQLILDASRK